MCKNNSHPLEGSVIIARGLTRSVSTMTRRWDPSKEATSMRSFTESVQNIVRPKWSMAIPSGLSISVKRLHFLRFMKTVSWFRADWKWKRKIQGSFNVTWSNDCNGLPPLNAGLADWGRCDFSPVDHLLHTVICHSNDYLLLQRGQQATISEVHFFQMLVDIDRNNAEQMCFSTLTSRHKSKQTEPHTEQQQLGQTSDQLVLKSA